ncbi:MAG: 2-C-methyl-D-erythritol 2,4-cyclodiphosphate synthase [Bacteroidales bacterium]|nr:2-C-methyl-D-erythritol 2,4-cyclodiphosphate synthase [Candidatus Cacconaster equifaecalis]
MDIRIGNGYDVHALAEGLTLTLGGVRIPFEKGCVAHSDGDVLIHALCDALLGALALGDIGRHFPDTDEKYRNIDSRLLLRKVRDMIAEKGYHISNADCTLLLQRPKVAPYIDEMRKCLASDLGVEISRIAVKATTTEHLGYEGRGEGISAMATVLLTGD